MESRNVSDQEGQGTGVMEDSTDTPKEEIHDSAGKGEAGTSDPLYVQKRLKQKERAHQREMAELRAEMQSLRAATSAGAATTTHTPSHNPYTAPLPENAPIHEHINLAVQTALGHRDKVERQAQEQAQQQHVARSYQELHKHLDNVSDKYEDFDDVVRGSDTPYTTTMRDYALTLPKSGPGSAGEVLYKLGKDPQKLRELSKLHPLDQGAEMSRLSHALIAGGSKGETHAPDHSQMGNIKSNPAANRSAAITEKSSPGDIRRAMKAGKFR
jgi:hypothetical protein